MRSPRRSAGWPDWPAHFLSGVLTHDPGMYPKRLILDDARQFGVGVLGLDVNASASSYVVEQSEEGHAIRLSLTDVKGISEAEVVRIVSSRDGTPYASLSDFFHRARVSRPVLERLVLAGGFDRVYGIGSGSQAVHRRGRVTRRDLLLQVAELDLHARALDRASRARGRGTAGSRSRVPLPATIRAADAAGRNSSDPTTREETREGVWAQAASQSRAARPAVAAESVQLTLHLGDEPGEPGERPTGLPEMTTVERMRAELEILGLDVSQHVITTYAPFLDALGITRSRDLLRRRSRAELLVAGVKVATQTPPVRSGRRVVFLTLDDGTGPVDATFFDDVQGRFATTVFSSWLLLVRGELRRTGRRGVSLRATGAWELPALHELWQRARTADDGIGLVRAELVRPVEPTTDLPPQRRVLVHPTGFRVSPYADLRPAGDDPGRVPRSLWHTSPGSPG